MTHRSTWALLILIVLLAGCGTAAQPIILETPAVSATLYVTPEPTAHPTRTPRATSSPRATTLVETPSPANKVNINTADADALASLPHIGPTLAQRIIAYRQEHGPFKRIEDIREVKGIGDAIFAAIKDFITLGESTNSNEWDCNRT
jgi:comEA protein